MLDEAFVKITCQPNTVHACRYLGRTAQGWTCHKLTAMAANIDARMAEGSMKATGDNCPGMPG